MSVFDRTAIPNSKPVEKATQLTNATATPASEAKTARNGSASPSSDSGGPNQGGTGGGLKSTGSCRGMRGAKGCLIRHHNCRGGTRTMRIVEYRLLLQPKPASVAPNIERSRHQKPIRSTVP
jgi:hypothetical protein